MEEKLKEIFNLEWIKDFAEKNIRNSEWIEEDGEETRRILVIDTLFDGGHGSHIPEMVLKLFGQTDEYDLEEEIYNELTWLENEINHYLNKLLLSKGYYYVGYHEADGSYCLFYEEYEEKREQD
jgi:hypothetical protein